jgi:hypothetical protein
MILAILHQTGADADVRRGASVSLGFIRVIAAQPVSKLFWH